MTDEVAVAVATGQPAGHRRFDGEWRSQVAHLLWEQAVASSNLASPTLPTCVDVA